MNKRILLLAFHVFLLFPLLLCAQNDQGVFRNKKKKKPIVKVNIRKLGPYIGIQRGTYSILEAGIEYNWKKIALRDARSHQIHTGFNYNFRYNMLGYDFGYWIKPHRIGLTYGARIAFRSNFDQQRIGIVPVIGFKFWILHLQTGVHLFANLPKENFQTNTLFISLRAGIANERSVHYTLRNGKKKKIQWLGK